MRNPEAVILRVEPDTGYANICPGCGDRSGYSKMGARILTMETCVPCIAKARAPKKIRQKKCFFRGVIK